MTGRCRSRTCPGCLSCRMAVMRVGVRITIPGSTTYLVGSALLPRLVFIRAVQAGDVYDPTGLVNPVRARWVVVPRTSVETMALMEEEDGTA